MKSLILILATLLILDSCNKNDGEQAPPDSSTSTPISVDPSSTSTNPVNSFLVQYYGGDLLVAKTDFHFLDPQSFSKEEFARAKDKAKIYCYFSSQFEDWRHDSKDFPKEALGNKLDKWAGEKWVDSRHPKVREIMNKRMDEMKSRGCDGIDPDNVDGYTYGPSRLGFPLAEADAIEYVNFFLKGANDRGMLFSLKNAPKLIPFVKADAYFVESCQSYDECHKWKDLGKPVFNVEYGSCKKIDYMYSIKKSSMKADFSLCK